MTQNKSNLLNTQSQNYVLSKKDQKRLMKMFDEPKMEDYFKSQKASTDNQQISYFYVKERFQNILSQIDEEGLNIPKLSQKIDDFLIKEKINEQQLKANKLKAKKQAIMCQLQLLQEQVSKPKRKRNPHNNKSLDVSRTSFPDQNNEFQNIEQMPKLNGKLILSKKQHQDLVHKIVKQREERDKKRAQYLVSLAEANKKSKQKQQKQLQQKKQQQKKKKLIQIQQNLKKHKEYHDSLIQHEKSSQKVFQQLKNKKFLHQELEEKYYNKIRLPLLEEQKRILRQKRQFAKAYSIDEIKNHQKSYAELKQSSVQKRSQVKEIKPHYHPPQKSSKLQKILQQQKLTQRKKVQDKKIALQEKIHRQQNYVEYLKEKFVPKSDPAKQQQIERRLQNFTKRRQPELSSKVIGMNYLQEAKKMRKKTHAPTDIQKEDQALLKAENKTALSDKQKQSRAKNLSSSNRFHSDYYQKQRRKNIQKLIYSDDCDQNQKIKKLKMQAQKINQAFQMKQQLLKNGGYNQKIQDEAVELLLSSIQAKMGIIDIYK